MYSILAAAAACIVLVAVAYTSMQKWDITQGGHTTSAHHDYIGFEIVRALTLKSTVICNMTPFILIEVHPRFWGRYGLHLQGRIVNKRLLLLVHYLLFGHENIKCSRSPPKRLWDSKGLYDYYSRRQILLCCIACGKGNLYIISSEMGETESRNWQKGWNCLGPVLNSHN